VNAYEHAAWHKLFSNKTAHEIADAINKIWLDPDFRFDVICKNPKSKNYSALQTSSDFECRICGKSYGKSYDARKCEKRGLIAPRYKNGDSVLIKIKNKRAATGTIIGWDKDHAIHSHDYEMYTVFLPESNKEIGVYGKNIKGKVSRRGRAKKMKKRKVFSLHKLIQAAKKAGF